MDLKTNDGAVLVKIEEWDMIRNTSLEVRKLIIVYNKTKNETVLNKCCRVCNNLLVEIDKAFNT